MADNRTLRNVTIAVWVVAGAVVLGLAFMKGTTPTPVLSTAAGARPVMYEFSSQT